MKTKILIALLFVMSALSGCKDEKAEEKAGMDAVIKVHDKAMGNSEIAQKYKSQLDSLIKTGTDTAKVKTIIQLRDQVNKADEAMEDWMHKFNPDFTGKSHTEIMDYLKAQQAQVQKVDSLLTVANKAAGTYLSSAK